MALHSAQQNAKPVSKVNCLIFALSKKKSFEEDNIDLPTRLFLSGVAMKVQLMSYHSLRSV